MQYAQKQPIDQNTRIVAVLAIRGFVLIDRLQKIVMHTLFVQKLDIFTLPIGKLEMSHMIALEDVTFIHVFCVNRVALLIETLPFGVAKTKIVELF